MRKKFPDVSGSRSIGSEMKMTLYFIVIKNEKKNNHEYFALAIRC